MEQRLPFDACLVHTGGSFHGTFEESARVVMRVQKWEQRKAILTFVSLTAASGPNATV